MTSTATTATVKRTVAKALTYRALIMTLDMTALYVFTRRVDIALGFTLASNVYTTIGYFVHERLWERVRWGRR